ncbi:MAG: trehalose-phosphatase [Lautropia sp.]
MTDRPPALDEPVARRWLDEAIARRPLVAFDFDGTLAPLVPEPEKAAMDPRARERLERLRRRFPVAVVSGRGLADLRDRIGIDGIALVGSHGSEWPQASGDMAMPTGDAPAGDDGAALQAQRDAVAGWVAQLRALLPAAAPEAVLEVKRLSLSLHYRHAHDPMALRERLARLFEGLRPQPTRIDGKFVWNLIPPGAPTKFDALEKLLRSSGAGTVIFVGDDATDELVFEHAPAEWLTVRVFDGEAGLAAGSRTAARACVDGVDGVMAMLARLTAAAPAAVPSTQR